MKIQPVDSFVRAGFVKKLSEQFLCRNVVPVDSPDETRNLKTWIQNKTPTYPFMFVYESNGARNTNSYLSGKLARTGIPAVLSDDNRQYGMVRLVPWLFTMEITFWTNKMSGEDLDSAESFKRRHAFLQRNGGLNFTVNYGITSLPISVVLPDEVQVPRRDSPTDGESIIKVVSSMTVAGYLSEPVLGTKGRVNQIQISSELPPTTGLPGEQFFPF